MSRPARSMGGFGGGDKRKDTQDNDAVTNAAESTEAQADANNQPQPPDNADMQAAVSQAGGKQPQGHALHGQRREALGDNPSGK